MSFHKTLAVRFCWDKVPIIVIIGPDSVKSYIRIYTLFVSNRLKTACLSQNVAKAFHSEKFVNLLYIILCPLILRLPDRHHHVHQM